MPAESAGASSSRWALPLRAPPCAFPHSRQPRRACRRAAGDWRRSVRSARRMGTACACRPDFAHESWRYRARHRSRTAISCGTTRPTAGRRSPAPRTAAGSMSRTLRLRMTPAAPVRCVSPRMARWSMLTRSCAARTSIAPADRRRGERGSPARSIPQDWYGNAILSASERRVPGRCWVHSRTKPSPSIPGRCGCI